MNSLLSTPKEKIAFVGDDSGTHSFLTGYLEKNKYNVMKKSHGPPEEILEGDVSLVLLELHPHIDNGLKVITGIRSLFHKRELPIIILSRQESAENIARLFFLGVNEILFSTMNLKEMELRINTQIRVKQLMESMPTPDEKDFSGGGHLSPRKEFYLFERKCFQYSITPRQKEIIRLTAKGLCNKEIACHMNIATGTVSRHLENLYAKCKVQNRTELASLFYDRNWGLN